MSEMATLHNLSTRYRVQERADSRAYLMQLINKMSDTEHLI